MNKMSSEEQARRLNMCLEAGLTVVYRSNPQYKGCPTQWTVIPHGMWGGWIDPNQLPAYDFLVLRPGETVDSFTIE